MITRWLETTSILVVIGRFYRYQFKSNYLKYHRPLTAFFLNFWYLHAISNGLKQKMSLIVKYSCSYFLVKVCLFKCITGLVSENSFAVNVLTGPKNSKNVEKSSFILIFLHSGTNWVRKSYFQSGLGFWNCLVTRWLPTASILAVIERIYRYHFKLNYLKNHRLFAAFLLNFWNLYTIFNVPEKNEPHSQEFMKWLTPKYLLISMHNRVCFWKPFGRERIH